MAWPLFSPTHPSVSSHSVHLSGEGIKLAKANFSPSMVMSAFPFNGSATGIDHIATDADTTKSVYDLSGRRVNKAIKGIYIVNGKKVLVK